MRLFVLSAIMTKKTHWISLLVLDMESRFKLDPIKLEENL